MEKLTPLGYCCNICFVVFRLKREVKFHKLLKHTEVEVDRPIEIIRLDSDENHDDDEEEDDDDEYSRHTERKNVDTVVVKTEEKLQKSNRKLKKKDPKVDGGHVVLAGEISLKLEENSSKSNDSPNVQQVNRCPVCFKTFRQLKKLALHLNNRHRLPALNIPRQESSKHADIVSTSTTTTTNDDDDDVNGQDDNNWESISSDESAIYIGKQLTNNWKRKKTNGKRKRKGSGETKPVLSTIGDNDEILPVKSTSSNDSDDTLPVMKRSKTKTISSNGVDPPPPSSSEINNSSVEETNMDEDKSRKDGIGSLSARRESSDTVTSRDSTDSGMNANFDLCKPPSSRRASGKSTIQSTKEDKRITIRCGTDKKQKREKGSIVVPGTVKQMHICPYCPNSFGNLSAFANHQKMHEAEMPYLCRFCDCRFDQFNHRMIHERIHGGQAGSLTK